MWELGAVGPHHKATTYDAYRCHQWDMCQRGAGVGWARAGEEGNPWESNLLLALTSWPCPGQPQPSPWAGTLIFIPQELHGLDGLQVLVQFIDYGNASRQVQPMIASSERP